MHINILFIATLLYALLSNSGCYAAVSIPGYEYVGEGSCLGANGGYHPSPLSVSATDTFDPNDGEVNCATYCNNFRSIGESFRGFDTGGYICQCRFDAGVTEELLSPIYMSLENEVNWVDQFPYYVETGEITSSDGYSYDTELSYCYKAVPFGSPPIDDEDTECVDTQDYEDQWGGSCEEYESNAAWCGGYGAMGESGLTPNENCCVCKSKLVSSTSVVIVEDTIAYVSSPCFNADDGGRHGVLYNAVRAYVDQDCANNQECEIGQTYGWPMNSWCVKNVKDMSYLFFNMDTFNDNISGWNTSSVTDMNSMFYSLCGASLFNGDLSNFDTSSVTDMSFMFYKAISFDRDVSNFDTSSVTDMGSMFSGALAFNGNLSSFDTSSVTNMESMFEGAASFNMDLCSWRDSFPYRADAEEIFTDSGCTYQDTPQEAQNGPFCASDCQSSSVTPVPVGVPLSATSPPTAAAAIDETAIQETLENSEANTIEIKLKPYADLDWRNMILFEPYVPSPIVSASCSNYCPCSFPFFHEDDCQCEIEMACGGTIPIDLASGNELKIVWEASSDNDKFVSVTGTSRTEVEIRLTIQDCTAPYQRIHGSNVTIVIDGLDDTEQKYTFDAESSFFRLGSGNGFGDICDVFTSMRFDPNENGVLDMKFTTLTFTAGYDNTKVTDETSYTWATDSYTWIRQPEGGSIELLDMLAGYSTPTPVPVGGAPSNAIYYESFEDGVLPDLWSTSFSYAPKFRHRGLQEDFRFAWTISSESPLTGVYSVKNPEVSFGSGGFLGEYNLTLTTPQDWGAGSLYFSILSFDFSSVGYTEDLKWYIDDKYESQITKGTDWELYNVYLESGQHEVTWMYTADVPSGYSGGKTKSSATYLDDLYFIPDQASVLDDNTQTDSKTEEVEIIDETSEANSAIEIKLKPYTNPEVSVGREMILFEPYVPSPIVSTSCSNKCPWGCSSTPYDEDDCSCEIRFACGGTIPIDLASGNELKFVWEASSDNDKYISVAGTSRTRVEFRLTIQDCTAPYQLIHGSNVTIVINGLDDTEQKYTFDAESSFVILGGSCDGCSGICDVYTRMQFDPKNGVLDMKFKSLTFTAGYDNTEVTDETAYTWATDSYTWIRQPEGGSIELLDILAGSTNDETSYPGDVGGFDYVGIGNCRDSREQSYPSVTQIYTFSTEGCADFCMKVDVDQSLGVLRGYVWGGDISGGLQVHCNCCFDAGADTEAIALQYGGEREHWGNMEPARFSTEGQGNGMISGTAESDYEVYCYKVDQTVDSEPTTSQEPWGVEETSALSTDTPSKQMTFPPYSFDSTFFSSSNTPTVAVCPEEEAAFQSCITVDVDNIGSFVDCSLCGLEAMGDDIFDFDGFCQRWDKCVSEMCPESCVEPINAYQKCMLDDWGILDLVDCFDSDSTDPIMDSTGAQQTDNISPSPTMTNVGIYNDQFCLEETKAVEECGIYDPDNVDMAEACAICQVEAMGDDIMTFNTDSFCNKWKACSNEKCPEDCISPMNGLQMCMFKDTGMTVDCLSSPDNANADNVESKAPRRQVITAVMIMGICGVLFV